jgi:phosphoribosylanthranilate isomerase
VDSEAPRIKICGITCREDAERAVELGAWALGFVFHAESPRCIRPEEAGRIAAAVGGGVEKVGVFVDAEPAAIRATAAAAGLTAVQLHGRESRAMLDELRRGGLEAWKAFRVGAALPAEEIAPFQGCTLLLDALVKGMAGGTGTTFPWDLATEAKKLGRVILAGGLNPGNIREAIRRVRPYALDVGSGVELRPGRKDPALLARLFEAAAGM